MRPLLLALLGSPRSHGTSAQLLSAFCQELRGWEIQSFNLPALNIHPCQGCGKCRISGKCQQKDFMPQLFKAFAQANALVLAAPVYFYGFPAQTKAVIDRCQPLWHLPAWKKRPQRPAFFLSACAAAHCSEFNVITREAKAFFNTIAFHYTAAILLSGTEKSNAQKRLARAKQKARLLAQKLSRTQL